MNKDSKNSVARVIDNLLASFRGRGLPSRIITVRSALFINPKLTQPAFDTNWLEAGQSTSAPHPWRTLKESAIRPDANS